ncbi:MAG TPA: YbgF trimerization domain-containing protein, partial [Casimicrobiaceae bacterium]|nr:YbgF trimerization domain-containing protein [Casimicrobiaceae bacterium]
MTAFVHRKALVPLAALLFATAVAAPARGALFDDDEARRRIDELKVRVDQIERTLAQRLDALEAKGGAAVDLFNDVEQIKSDIAKLRGQYEVLTYELEQVQKRQKDLYLDLDSRLRRLEGGAGGAPG